MTDDDFDKVDEDFASEFDFVDANEGTQPAASTPGAPSPANRPPPPPSSAVISLMVLISLLGGGYYVYSHFFSNKSTATKESATKTTTANNALPVIPEQPVQPAQPAPAPAAVAEALNKTNHELSAAIPPPPAPAPAEKSFEQVQKELHPIQPQTSVPVEVRTALQNISDEMTVNVNNIKQLEGAITNVAATLDHLNKTINAMDNRILSLTETVDGLSQDLSNVKRIMVDQDLDLTMPGNMKMSSSKKQMQTITSSEPNYSVHAIIPGRAWLKSSSGQILTVTEGDKIGDYGTVAVIDAANGLVRTSSGIIIR